MNVPMKTWCCVSLIALLGTGCQATANGRIKAAGAVKTNADGSVSVEAKAEADAEVEEPAPKEDVSYDDEKKIVKYDDDSKGEIKFKYNSDEFDGDDSTHILDGVVKFLKKYPEVTVTIEGHTDSRGDEDYNRKLSDKRAAKIHAYLTSKGVDGARLKSVGRGEDDAKTIEEKAVGCFNQLPKDLSACETVWRESRKAVFRVTSGVETIKKPKVVKKAKPKPEPAPEEPVKEPAPEEPTTWQIGVRAGYAVPMGDAFADTKLTDNWSSGIPLQLHVGYRVVPTLVLGAYFGYGPLVPKECPDGSSCTHDQLRFGVQGYLHFNKDGPWDPWFGVGVGYELARASETKGGAEVKGTISGMELVNLQTGVDYRVNRNFGVGPFASLALAQYSSSELKISGTGTALDGERTTEFADGDKRLHQWFTVGLRGVFDF